MIYKLARKYRGWRLLAVLGVAVAADALLAPTIIAAVTLPLADQLIQRAPWLASYVDFFVGFLR